MPKVRESFGKPAEGPRTRANAAGHLTRFSNDPRGFPALVRALADPEAAVRVVAALRMNPNPANREAAVTALVRALGDPATTVRVSATVSLVSMGISRLPGDDGERCARAKPAFR